MNKAAIYTISFNNKPRIYIGSTLNHNRRKSQHLWMLRRNIHDNKKLQNYYNKYGEKLMEFKVIETFNIVDFELIRKTEQEYLNKYFAQEFINSGFKDKRFDKLTLNITPEVGLTRVNWTKERKEALSKRNKDFIWTDEMKQNMSKIKTGIKQSKEMIDNRMEGIKINRIIRNKEEDRQCPYCLEFNAIKLGFRFIPTKNINSQRCKCIDCDKMFKIDII